MLSQGSFICRAGGKPASLPGSCARRSPPCSFRHFEVIFAEWNLLPPQPLCVHPRGRRGAQAPDAGPVAPSAGPVAPCPPLLPALLCKELGACCLHIQQRRWSRAWPVMSGRGRLPAWHHCLFEWVFVTPNAGLHQEQISGEMGAGSRSPLAAGPAAKRFSRDWCSPTLGAACCSRSRGGCSGAARAGTRSLRAHGSGGRHPPHHPARPPAGLASHPAPVPAWLLPPEYHIWAHLGWGTLGRPLGGLSRGSGSWGNS